MRARPFNPDELGLDLPSHSRVCIRGVELTVRGQVRTAITPGNTFHSVSNTGLDTHPTTNPVGCSATRSSRIFLDHTLAALFRCSSAKQNYRMTVCSAMPYLTESHDLNLFRATEIVNEPAKQQESSMMNGDVRKLTSFPALEAQQDKGGVTCLETVADGTAPVEAEKVGDMMEGVEYTSRPPTPESGAATPTLRIEQCPMRLRSLVPPPNYGAIKTGAVFRSAFPQDRNVEFLKGLDVKTVLYVPLRFGLTAVCLLTRVQLLGRDRAFGPLQPVDTARQHQAPPR